MPVTSPEPAREPTPAERRGIFATLRVRTKLIVLHTCFFIGLAAMLLVSLRPAVSAVVREAEWNKAAAALRHAALQSARGVWPPILPDEPQLEVLGGTPEALGLRPDDASRAALDAGRPVPGTDRSGRPLAVIFVPRPEGDPPGTYFLAAARIPEARDAVLRLYMLVTVALLAVYALIAVALEIFVLPRQVYEPIARFLDADRALRAGNVRDELIPDALIPADEIGEIMRSRNASVAALRGHQTQLADALGRLETVATDLKRKNHLLETARRNLADADRLASLGMMSAGIAHELNTPLSVLKGCVEQIERQPGVPVDPARAALMLRVVRRLERLSESLLDFARVRPPTYARVALRSVAEEAATLVALDRDARSITIDNRIAPDLMIECDPDRLVQVLVNLLRNAVDAMRPVGSGRIDIDAEPAEREGRPWISLRVTDEGPGIDPAILPRLFEPFASTRLDDKGAGLGLAVSDGIVREHGGVLLARNRPDAPGAIFEAVLPAALSSPDPLDAGAAHAGP